MPQTDKNFNINCPGALIFLASAHRENGIAVSLFRYNQLFLYILLNNRYIPEFTDNMPTLTGKMGMRPSKRIKLIAL